MKIEITENTDGRKVLYTSRVLLCDAWSPKECRSTEGLVKLELSGIEMKSDVVLEITGNEEELQTLLENLTSCIKTASGNPDN